MFRLMGEDGYGCSCWEISSDRARATRGLSSFWRAESDFAGEEHFGGTSRQRREADRSNGSDLRRFPENHSGGVLLDLQAGSCLTSRPARNLLG